MEGKKQDRQDQPNTKDESISSLEAIKNNFREMGLDPNATQDVLSRKTFPLIYDVGSRVAIGTSVGFGFGMIFFKRWPVRRFTTMFGLGVGLGLNY